MTTNCAYVMFGAAALGTVIAQGARAEVINVPEDYASIQAAIDAASESDEIVVAPGTYYENVYLDGKNVILRAENPSAELADPLDPTLASIIDGSQPDDPDYASCVRFRGTELPECELDGFTLTGGEGTFSSSGWTEGGGVFGGDEGQMWVWTQASISDCTIISNHAQYGGGLWQCGGVISNCHVTNNSTPDVNANGGGLGACNGTIVDCTITDNFSDGGGGLYSCIGLIINCDISGNQADWSGGAMMWCDDCTVVGCNISDNVASLSGYGAGGAVFSQRATYTNCTFANNTALSGGAIYAWQFHEPTLYNCILWGNLATTNQGHQIQLNTSSGSYCTLTIAYSDLEGGQDGVWKAYDEWCIIDWGDGMIEADPAFADPDAGDFRPAAGSPCIDAADNTRVPGDLTADLDGNPRFVDDPDTPDTGFGDPPIVDMGPYEFQSSNPADVNNDGVVDIDDIFAVLAGWGPCDDPSDCPADVNGDGFVDIDDLFEILANWT